MHCRASPVAFRLILVIPPTNRGAPTIPQSVRPEKRPASIFNDLPVSCIPIEPVWRASRAEYAYTVREANLRQNNEHLRETRFRDLLDRLPQAIVALNRRGRVLFANAAARTVLSKGDGLTLRNRHLHIIDAAANTRMCTMLEDLFRDDPETGLSAGGQVVVRRTSGQPVLVLTGYCLTGLAGTPTDYEDVFAPAAVLFIYDPAVRVHPPASALAQAFTLTRREAGLAAALLQGQTLHEHAATRGVKITTVRTQLLSLMRKTDTRSQADLVRLLSGYAAALPGRLA